jgi:hypothetical protein
MNLKKKLNEEVDDSMITIHKFDVILQSTIYIH